MNWRKMHRNRRKRLTPMMVVYCSYIADGVKTELPPMKMRCAKGYTLNEITFVTSHPEYRRGYTGITQQTLS